MEQRERRDTLPARALRREAACLLKAAGIEEADADAGQLLFHAAGFDAASYLLHAEEPLPEPVRRRFMESVRRRADREPLQYIIGEAPFYGRLFVVRPGVLIPRFDTETLVERMLPYTFPGARILDLCTGSGCILLTLFLEGNGPMKGTGTDLSDTALGVARGNAARFGVDASFLRSDVYTNVSGVYDIITANPPYIRTDVIASLDPEVRDHEPRLALDGDADGMRVYRSIIGGASAHLSENGVIGLEIGFDQAEEVSALMEASGFRKIEVTEDLAGRPRAVTGRRGGS